MGKIPKRYFEDISKKSEWRKFTMSSNKESKIEEKRSYAFDLDTEEEDAMNHLEKYGFVVIKECMSRLEVEDAVSELWIDLEKQNEGLKRNDPSTWDACWFKSKQPCAGAPGLLPSLAQSSGAWKVRGQSKVKRSFASIWKTDDLITSMDCVIAWRPWWMNKKWTPRTEGLHIDQNPFSKPNLETVQGTPYDSYSHSSFHSHPYSHMMIGMVPLHKVTAQTGGLEVVPFSHLPDAKEAYKKKYPNKKCAGDWCTLTSGCELGCKRMLVLANPGDLILWDSRTIHGGKVGTGVFKRKNKRKKADLARLSVTVCMTQKSRASKEVLIRRRTGFKKGECFNHTPHEAGTSSGTIRCKIHKDYKPIELTKTQLELLG